MPTRSRIATTKQQTTAELKLQPHKIPSGFTCFFHLYAFKTCLVPQNMTRSSWAVGVGPLNEDNPRCCSHARANVFSSSCFYFFHTKSHQQSNFKSPPISPQTNSSALQQNNLNYKPTKHPQHNNSFKNKQKTTAQRVLLLGLRRFELFHITMKVFDITMALGFRSHVLE